MNRRFLLRERPFGDYDPMLSLRAPQPRPRLDRLLTASLCVIAAAFTHACAPAPPKSAAPGDIFWQALSGLCGQAFEGRVVEGTAPGDATFASQRLLMHVRECNARQLRIPFHVGDDRSRTWVVTRLPEGGLRLKHDHRHADGSEDAITQYGGDTAVASAALTQDFHADAHTAKLIPAAASNIWTLGVSADGARFTYALRREAEGRRFRVDFDLTRPVAPPPPPWGAMP